MDRRAGNEIEAVAGHAQLGPEGRIPRRIFIRRTAIGSAVLGLSSLLPAGCTRYEPPEEKLASLPAREYRILEALADTLIPPGGPIPQSGSQMGVPRDLDRYFATEDPAALSDFRSALLLIELGPPFHSAQFRRFTSLIADDRRRYFEGWLTSRLAFKRMVAGGLKKAILFAYYCHDEVWPHMGYDGPWIGVPAGTAGAATKDAKGEGA